MELEDINCNSVTSHIRTCMYSQSSAVICEEEEVVSCCRGHSLGMFNAAAVALALYPLIISTEAIAHEGSVSLSLKGGVFHLL